MSLVSDLITQSFLDLGVIAPLETISTAMQSDAFLRLNQLLASLSAEGLPVYTQMLQTFALAYGQVAYALGPTGSWGTTARAQKVVGWKASSGVFSSGGKALSLAEFDAACAAAYQAFVQAASQAAELESAVAAKVTALMGPFYQTPAFAFPAISLASANVPMVLGADTAYPLINVRVFPAPAAAGTMELAYWVPLPSFVTVGDAINLPPGYEDMLHFNLAARLYPQYPRPSNQQVVFAMADRTKAALIEQQTMSTPQPQPSAPQGQ